MPGAIVGAKNGSASLRLGEPKSNDPMVQWSNDNYPITLWLFNIAMENGPFIDGLPIKNGDFPWLC